MDKSCANHPESMALATCKACEKSVCLMCVVDEKEGTFCSADCHTAFSNGQEVPKFVGAAQSASGGSGVQKIDSIFDDGPSPSAAGEQEAAPPAEGDPMPIVAEGTKWRAIGSPCMNHADTPAVANCDRCGKPVCALCLLEASQGTFCSSECMGTASQAATEEAVNPRAKRSRQAQPAENFSAAAEKAALQGKPVFKFKEPPRSNKSLIAVAVVILLAAGAAGAYYGWNAFTPESYPKQTDHEVAVNPSDVTKPDTTKPDAIKPDSTIPDSTKPDTSQTETPKPDTSKPDTTKPDVTAYVPSYLVVKPPPRLVVVPTRSLNPWADTDQGSWYRFRSTRGSKMSYTDIGLKEKGKDFVVLVTQTCAEGQASAVSESKKPADLVYLRGEETFAIDGQTFLCEIQSPGTEDSAPKLWSLLSGRYRGAILKSVTPEGTLTTRRVWDHTMRVRGTTIDCLVVEGQLQGGSASRSVKSMYAGSIPMGLIYQEKDGETMVLLDMGSDWSKRPAFPK
jgi:hypothetical protein